jgi:hypothetical protein
LPSAFAETTADAAKATAEFVGDVSEAVADKAVAAAKATAEVVEAVAGGRVCPSLELGRLLLLLHGST